MKREDIKVTFENNVLTIEGERKLDEIVAASSITGSSARTAPSAAALRCRRRSIRRRRRPSTRTAC